MRTITHTAPAPVRVDLTVDIATVEVIAEPREDATVTLEPVTATDHETLDLIERTTYEADGPRLAVRVPRPAGTGTGATTVIRNGTVSVSARHVSGNLTGATIVNGQIITGPGTVVIGSTGGMRITVRLPEHSSIALSGNAPDLTTRGPLSGVDTQIVSGDVHVDHAKRVGLRTTSGDVRVGRSDDVNVRSVSGDVTVHQLAGRAVVATVSGDISIHAVSSSTVTAKSVSGDLDLSAPQGVEIETDTRTVSGNTRNHRR